MKSVSKRPAPKGIVKEMPMESEEVDYHYSAPIKKKGGFSSEEDFSYQSKKKGGKGGY